MDEQGRETLDYATPTLSRQPGYREPMLPTAGAFVLGVFVGLITLAPVCLSMMFYHPDLDIWVDAILSSVAVGIVGMFAMVFAFLVNRFWEGRPRLAFLIGLISWSPIPIFARFYALFH